MRKSILAIIILFIWAGSALAALPLPIDTRPIYVIERSNGNELKIDENGAIDSFTQDQTTPPLDLFFTQAKGAPTALTTGTSIDDLTITVDSVVSFSVGDYVGVFSGISDEGRFYFGEVLSISVNTLTMDTPLDFAFDAGDPVISTSRDLNVNGSVTPQIFAIQAGGAGTPIEVDITRIMIQITTTDPPAFDEFGDIATGLLKGIVLRRVDGDTRNIWNVKSNGEFANLAYDLNIFEQTGPLGVNGIAVRFSFAGQDKHGVAVRLSGGDGLELIIQDDLSTLVSFRIIAQGHIVD